MKRLASLVAQYALPPGAEGALGVLLDALAGEHSPTTVRDTVAAVDVHIADALTGLEVPALREAATIADLAAGAGIPGLVLAAALPAAHVYLVESVSRKAEWAQQTAREMGLENVEAIPLRAEEWQAGRNHCAAVTARALASLPVVCEYAAPLLRDGGTLVAWKGAAEEAELRDGVAAAGQLGLEPSGVIRTRPYAQSRDHTLHLYSKVRPTPDRFPRRAGMATKRPLSADKHPRVEPEL